VNVGVGLFVIVALGVAVGVQVGVAVGVHVGVAVGLKVGVAVSVGVAVGKRSKYPGKFKKLLLPIELIPGMPPAATASEDCSP